MNYSLQKGDSSFGHCHYSGRKADRVKVSVALSNFFFLGGGGGSRYGPRDKTSGHELLFSGSFFVLGWYELCFLSNSLNSRSRSLFSGRKEC